MLALLAAELAAAPQLSPAETRMAATVDAEFDRSVATLEALVNQNSGTMNIAGVTAVGTMMRRELEPLGFAVTWKPMTAAGRAGHLIAVHRGAAGTKRLAEEEARTRVTDTVVLVAAVASLAAVAEALVRSGRQDAVGVATVVLGLLVVVLSWALVNTVFALKYARLYYSGGDGGIEFGQQDPPAYSDFAYLAFTVGMSFSVPDTSLADTSIRKVGLGHALLSYLFGTVVITVAVNLVTNLGQA